ncbi:MAG: hypothetical protein ACTSYB_15680 [Candidatus Helarchaeota archaeon]
MNDDLDEKQRGIERFILLVLGAFDRKISMLHLEKEVFLLWNFHPIVKNNFNFIQHYRGPFSREIQEIIRDPIYLENCWKYTPPQMHDILSGGFVELTDKGRKEYKKLIEKIKSNADLRHLNAAIKMVRELYDKLSAEELLLLIYDTYPQYTVKSSVYNTIKRKKLELSKKLSEKKLIDKERFKSLLIGSVYD